MRYQPPGLNSNSKSITILLDVTAPETGKLSVDIHADVLINISADEAQRRVTQYVHRKISSQMHGETPALILGNSNDWRVPVHLTFPALGDVGRVGTIDVNVETGELKLNEASIQLIERHAEDLARRIARPPAR